MIICAQEYSIAHKYFVCIIIILGFAATSIIIYRYNKGVLINDTENISLLTSEGIYNRIDSIFTKPINISLTMANDSLLKNFILEEEQHIEDEAFINVMKTYLHSYKEKYNYDSVFLASCKTDRYYYYNGFDRVLDPNDPEDEWYYSFLASEDEHNVLLDNDEVIGANNDITVFVNCKIRDDAGNI